MSDRFRRLARPLRRAASALLRHVPTIRRRGRFGAGDLRAVGHDEALLFEAVAANVNQNDRALYNLVHVHRLLRLMTGAVGEDLRGKVVLELGASPDPTLPLILLMDGAEKVVANNILPLSDGVSAPTVRLLGLLLLALRDVPPERLDEILTWHDDGRSARLRPERLERHAGLPAEDLPLPPESVDAVFSVAVLEHVRKPRAVLAKSLQLLRPGGWCFHAIDLRDHRDFTRPIEFLKLTEDAYLRATGGSENRVRAGEFVELFRQAGFEVVRTLYQDRPYPVTPQGHTDLVGMASWPLDRFYPRASLDAVEPWVGPSLRAELAEPFRSLDAKELSTLGVVVIARKPSGG